MLVKYSALYIYLLSFYLSSAVEHKVVKTTQGKVKGYRSDDGDFFVFYGIPYATAPKGIHKFKAPLPAPMWLETFEAVNKNIVCPQNPVMLQNHHKVDEDCLIANVYVPDTEETNLPVVVYIHGGGFNIGYGDATPPKSIVQEGNVIAVNFNYRLGVNGFLCLGTKTAPGNAGLKDQLALLRWVKYNIASFGGNPNDVTLAGYSAGAWSVDFLMISPAAKGLFHKAIFESGAAISGSAIQQNPFENAKSFARRFNDSSDDIAGLERFFTTASSNQLIIDTFLRQRDSTVGFTPCVERDIGEEIVLKEAPINILRKGKYHKIPVLMGHADKEGLFRADVFDDWKDNMNNKFSDFLPQDLKFKDSQEREDVANTIKKFYFGGKPIDLETSEQYLNYFGDIIFAYPTLRSVKLQVNAGSESLYLYEYSFFDETTIRSKYDGQSIKINGASHCSQTFAILNYPEEKFIEANYSEEYKIMKGALRSLWINFIKTGKPVPPESDIIPEGWPAVSVEQWVYMSLNRTITLKKDLIKDRFDFWEGIYEKYYSVPAPPPEQAPTHPEL